MNPFVIDSPQALQEVAGAFQRSRILLTAFELGIFSALGADAVSVEALAPRLGLDLRALTRLLDALVVLGLVEKRQGGFSNSPLARSHLVKGEPGYMGNLGHSASLWHTWSTLTEAVRQGRSVLPPLEDRAPDWFADFIGAMHFRAERYATDLAKLLALPQGARVLDVGGGSGAYSMAFVRSAAEVRATIFDLPPVIALARDYVARGGCEKFIDFREGNFLRDDIGSGYDLVFLSAIIHCVSPAENRALLSKCAAALRPGGRIAISDFHLDDSRTNPPLGALFALNMLVGTASGDTYSVSEVSEWLTAVGFGDIGHLSTGEPASLIVGCRRSHA